MVGGNAARLFTTGAMSLLGRHSRNIPRIINVMCDNALLIGFAKSSKKIDETIMLEVIRDMNGALLHAHAAGLPVIEAERRHFRLRPASSPRSSACWHPSR
jgi:hypothetical protein